MALQPSQYEPLSSVANRMIHAFGNTGNRITCTASEPVVLFRWDTRLEIRFVSEEGCTILEIAVYAFGAKQEFRVCFSGGTIRPLEQHLIDALNTAGKFPKEDISFVT